VTARARHASALACWLTLLVVAGAACSDDAGAGDEQTLTVFAAASLTEAFTTLEDAYEKDHEGVDVVLSFGSSTTLAEQITEGAPADVLATADEVSMGIVVDADMADGDPVPLASNTLTVVTPPGNPGDVGSVQDLGSVAYVVCAEEVPCGAAAAGVLRKAKISQPPASFEADVKAVLAKVTLGEVDAGLVYVTDAVAAGDDVDQIDIPAALNVVNPYYIAAVADSEQQDLADDWIALVTSQAGLRVLADAGFGPP
jgi:molybdate transport system substrate-binding protein